MNVAQQSSICYVSVGILEIIPLSPGQRMFNKPGLFKWISEQKPTYPRDEILYYLVNGNFVSVVDIACVCNLVCQEPRTP